MAAKETRDPAAAAAVWFYLPAMFDAISAPTRWVWKDEDHAWNDALTRAVGAEPEMGATEWKSAGARKPSQGREDTDWQPRYFPDDPWDETVARSKHDLVMDASVRRKQAIEDLMIAEGRRIDASGVLDALSGGELLFSPLQYGSIVNWLNQGVVDFASNPDVRWQIYRMWTDAPLLGEPEDAERAQQMLRGGSVYAISPKTAECLGRIMRGEK